MKALRRKLKSTRGESLAEVLVASLIVAISLLLLASMVTASYHIIDRSKNSMDQYYAGISKMSDPTAEAPTPTPTQTDANVSIKGSGVTNISVPVYVYTDSGDSGSSLSKYETKKDES